MLTLKLRSTVRSFSCLELQFRDEKAQLFIAWCTFLFSKSHGRRLQNSSKWLTVKLRGKGMNTAYCSLCHRVMKRFRWVKSARGAAGVNRRVRKRPMLRDIWRQGIFHWSGRGTEYKRLSNHDVKSPLQDDAHSQHENLWGEGEGWKRPIVGVEDYDKKRGCSKAVHNLLALPNLCPSFSLSISFASIQRFAHFGEDSLRWIIAADI